MWQAIIWTNGGLLCWCVYTSLSLNEFNEKNISACQWEWTESVLEMLTHWGRVTHICVTYLTIIVSDNGLSPSRHQAIIWTNDGILLIRPLGTNFSEILIEIHKISIQENAFENIVCEMTAILSRPQCVKCWSCTCMNLVINSFTIILTPDGARSSTGLGLIGEWNIVVPKLLPLLKIMNMCSLLNHTYFNPLRPRQNGHHFTEDTFKMNAFSWMKMFEIQLKFHWSLFLRVQLTIFQHWLR